MSEVDRGRFMDEYGNTIEDRQSPDDAFPILCGPWPNEHEHSIMRLCEFCTVSIGVSPRGVAYHDVNPEMRPLLCRVCFAALVTILKVVMSHDEE
jgi:hypothetical protein